MLTKTNVYLV